MKLCLKYCLFAYQEIQTTENELHSLHPLVPNFEMNQQTPGLFTNLENMLGQQSSSLSAAKMYDEGILLEIMIPIYNSLILINESLQVSRHLFDVFLVYFFVVLRMESLAIITFILCIFSFQ